MIKKHYESDMESISLKEVKAGSEGNEVNANLVKVSLLNTSVVRKNTEVV